MHEFILLGNKPLKLTSISIIFSHIKNLSYLENKATSCNINYNDLYFFLLLALMKEYEFIKNTEQFDVSDQKNSFKCRDKIFEIVDEQIKHVVRKINERVHGYLIENILYNNESSNRNMCCIN